MTNKFYLVLGKMMDCDRIKIAGATEQLKSWVRKGAAHMRGWEREGRKEGERIKAGKLN